MHKIKEVSHSVEEMLCTITGWAHEELSSGKECVCTDEMGQVIDMIKDLAEAEEKLWKAAWYYDKLEDGWDGEEEAVAPLSAMQHRTTEEHVTTQTTSEMKRP